VIAGADRDSRQHYCCKFIAATLEEAPGYSITFKRRSKDYCWFVPNWEQRFLFLNLQMI